MDSVALSHACAQFEGVLLEQVLTPLAEPLGQFGQLAMAPLAQSIAAHDARGFGALLATALQRQQDAR